MGIFNFFITFPQIVNGIFGGMVVKHIYGSNSVYALLLAGIFMILGAETWLDRRENWLVLVDWIGRI